MVSHMKTTMIIDDALYADVKRLAATRHQTATAIVEEALFALLRQYEVAATDNRPRFTFTGYGSAGPLPGVDLTDNAALRAVMHDSSATAESDAAAAAERDAAVPAEGDAA